MNTVFADRMATVPRSFIREILKVTMDRSIISFAGGLPSRELFPAEEIKAAASKVFDIFGRDIFQYSDTEGFVGLREMISARYWKKHNLKIPLEDILITNGSQQCLDLLGKIMLNEGDGLIIEEPGYLGAIQAFSIFKPRFHPIPLNEDGLDIGKLKRVLSSIHPKLMYTVPNFQNPSGISYSDSNRKEVAGLLQGTDILLIEDDPYGDLRYSGTSRKLFKSILPENTILLGTFSKTVIPAFRLGWVVAPGNIMEKLIVAKQAADLHTSNFTQCIIYQYLKDNDIEAHIKKLNEVYGRQMKAMLSSIDRHFPPAVTHTHPDGGMFLWATLPETISSWDVLDYATKDKVIFVPGEQFYINKQKVNTMRLNFSCVNEVTIDIGIERLGKAIRKVLS
jgi:2-aminoadipate transaminase